jgi:hypothetical protein
MKVTLPDRQLLIAFHNVSEKIEHDALPPGLAIALPNLFEMKSEVQHRRDGTTKIREHRAIAKEFKPYIKLRRPRCVSTITTICSIYDLKDTNSPISFGKAYYSRSEVPAGKRFDALAAQKKSLGRALADWSASDRHLVHTAFAAALDRRLKAAQARAQARLAAEATSGPSVTHSVPVRRSTN